MKEKNDKVTNRGIAAGSVLSGIGGTMIGSSKIVEKIAGSKPSGKLTQERIDKAKRSLEAYDGKGIKSKGKITAAIGGSLLAASVAKKIKDNKKK